MNMDKLEIAHLTPERFVRLYLKAIKDLIDRGESPGELIPTMLWGPPGIGKSQSIAELCSLLEKETGKKVVLTDIRLLLFSPLDLRGIPTYDEKRENAVWLRPRVLAMDPADEIINVLFLDEITAAPPSVQAAAYQLVLDRKIGEHKLPSNCLIFAAGNRTVDGSYAHKMPKALSNRLLHIEFSISFASWRKWALAHEIDGRVIGFLDQHPDLLLDFKESSSDLAFPTPRSYEMLSKALRQFGEGALALLPGIIGPGAAKAFKAYLGGRNIPDPARVYRGERPTLPRENDALYAFVSAMGEYAKEHFGDLKGLENSIVYAFSLPLDFQVVLFRTYLSIDRPTLLKIARFRDWLSHNAYLLDE